VCIFVCFFKFLDVALFYYFYSYVYSSSRQCRTNKQYCRTKSAKSLQFLCCFANSAYDSQFCTGWPILCKFLHAPHHRILTSLAKSLSYIWGATLRQGKEGKGTEGRGENTQRNTFLVKALNKRLGLCDEVLLSVLGALEVCSRRGAIQIHVYLTFTFTYWVSVRIYDVCWWIQLRVLLMCLLLRRVCRMNSVER